VRPSKLILKSLTSKTPKSGSETLVALIDPAVSPESPNVSEIAADALDPSVAFPCHVLPP
jgi:hypothetical protein